MENVLGNTVPRYESHVQRALGQPWSPLPRRRAQGKSRAAFGLFSAVPSIFTQIHQCLRFLLSFRLDFWRLHGMLLCAPALSKGVISEAVGVAFTHGAA